MKIWIVEHHYDNGESYEDYREYIDYTVFSTYDKAMGFYCSKIIPYYEGKYILKSIEADTQRWSKLEESPYVKCSSAWDSICDTDYDVDNSGYQDCDKDYDPYLYSYWNEDLKRWRYGEVADALWLSWMDYPEEDANAANIDYDEMLWNYEMSLLYRKMVREEAPIVKDWLTHKGENYQTFKEIEQCELEKLNRTLEELTI